MEESMEKRGLSPAIPYVKYLNHAISELLLLFCFSYVDLPLLKLHVFLLFNYHRIKES